MLLPRASICLSVLATVSVLTEALLAENWPQWRGPQANGISTETNLPTHWSADKNIAWKTPIPGWGNSTPIIWGDQIFLTTQVGEGPVEGRSQDFEGATQARRGGGAGGIEFVVQSIHRTDGRLLWEYKMAAMNPLQAVHVKHNLASPSCVTDGKLVFAWFGNGQIVALDLNGKKVWERHLGQEVAPYDVLWAHGSSPLLYESSLILLCDHPAKAYLLALDKQTGRQQWLVDRGRDNRSYTTPFVVRAEKGDELIINSNDAVQALNPDNGEPLWHAGDSNRVPVSTPVFHEGVLYTSRGHRSGPYMAVKVGGRGDVSKSHVKWEAPTGAPYVSSLLYYDGLVYMATETGIVTCVDAENGETVWRERFGGVFSASPVAGDGKVYLVEESGETFVLAAGREPKVLARNHLRERTLASPAISGGRIFMRTGDHLYCIRSN